MTQQSLLPVAVSVAPLTDTVVGLVGGISKNIPITLIQTTPGGDETVNTITVVANTADAFVYSDALKKVASTAAATNGQLLIGSTGAVPVAATLTGTANQVVV